MIINTTYFKGDIYISHAKPSISKTDNISNNVQSYIDAYAEECLDDCLGYSLSELLKAELDDERSTGLKEGADEKWDRLLNGYAYEDTNGMQVKWNGIRFKNTNSESCDRSFLADYVFFQYESGTHVTNAGTGQNIQKPKNGILVNPNHIVVKAWRRFIKAVQGDNLTPKHIINCNGYGIDYYNRSTKNCLYSFITDMNKLNGDEYYPNFQPKEWINMTTFGI